MVEGILGMEGMITDNEHCQFKGNMISVSPKIRKHNISHRTTLKPYHSTP